MKIHNPANGAVITDVAIDTSASVRAKYHRARAAQPHWAGLPIKKRLATIAAFRDRSSPPKIYIQNSGHEDPAPTKNYEI